MLSARMVLICSLVAVVACAADARLKAQEHAKPTLWESDRSLLFPALREFVLSPGTKPDRKFVTVNKGKDDEPGFKSVPDGWFTWKDDRSEGRLVVLDEDGFRILIRLEQVPDVEKALTEHIQDGRRSVVLIDHIFPARGTQVARVVKCAHYKGDTNFMEYRYFEGRKGAVCVKLTVFDFPKEKRTLDHLLAHLRSHYGKYEGVCQQVADLVADKK